MQRERLEQLLSEHADGGLTPDDAAAVSRAIERDPAAADAARAYARLGELLRGWRTLPSDVDWAQLAARTSQQVAETAATTGDVAVDDLLRASAGPMPHVDWTAQRRRISAAVRAEAAGTLQRPPFGRRRLLRRVAGIGAPLAAAAAIMLAVWRPAADRPAIPTVSPPPVIAVSLQRPGQSGRIQVSFDRTPPPAPVLIEHVQGSVIAAGLPVAEVADTGEVALLF